MTSQDVVVVSISLGVKPGHLVVDRYISLGSFSTETLIPVGVSLFMKIPSKLGDHEEFVDKRSLNNQTVSA